jgi:hypothetical protein
MSKKLPHLVSLQKSKCPKPGNTEALECQSFLNHLFRKRNISPTFFSIAAKIHFEATQWGEMSR